MSYKVGASLACADQLNLSKEIELLIKADIDFLHIDIMDGVYVENYCFGTQIFDYLEKYKDIEIEVHLMVDDPFRKLEFFKDKYFDKISFHIEACKNPIQTLAKIKSMNKEGGVALNASTNESSIYYLFEHIDYILVMAVEAGFTGQDFIQSSLIKIGNIKNELNKRKMRKDIYVDGHIDKDTITKLCKAGANAFVGGTSGLFRKGYPLEDNLRVLKESITVPIKRTDMEH